MKFKQQGFYPKVKCVYTLSKDNTLKNELKTENVLSSNNDTEKHNCLDALLIPLTLPQTERGEGTLTTSSVVLLADLVCMRLTTYVAFYLPGLVGPCLLCVCLAQSLQKKFAAT